MSTTEERVAQLDAAGLARLEANARKVIDTGPASRRGEAQAYLDAIDAERLRRSEAERREVAARKAEIEAEVRDLGLFDRVCLAFSKMPVTQEEADILCAVARNPGADGDVIAQAAGKRRWSYVNLAIGSLCAAREPWLVTQAWLAKPEARRWYSEFIIDFSHEPSPDGDRLTRWTLKPEAEAALRHLKVV